MQAFQFLGKQQYVLEERTKEKKKEKKTKEEGKKERRKYLINQLGI